MKKLIGTIFVAYIDDKQKRKKKIHHSPIKLWVELCFQVPQILSKLVFYFLNLKLIFFSSFLFIGLMALD